MAVIQPGIIILLACVGGVLLVVVGTTSIICFGRRRHRRALLSMNAAQVRRMSGMPGGNISMTDTEYYSLPRARGILRNSTPIPSGYTPSYATISSSESLPRRQVLTKAPRAILSNHVSNETEAHQRLYPVPRRLTRSNIVPLHKIQAAHPSTEVRSTMDSMEEFPLQTSDTQKSLPRSKTEPKNANQVHIPTGAPQSGLDPIASLKPKPLSINKRRSISFGALPIPSHDVKKPAGLYVVDTRLEEIQDRELPRMPRSTSLCAQQAGLVPTEPVPPLPLDIISRRHQSVRGLTEQQGSNNSLLSGGSSRLEDENCRCFSQAETDQTSLSPISSLNHEVAELNTCDKNRYRWEPEHTAEPTSPSNAVQQATARPQLQTQHSFPASTQQSLTRRSSSGLSMSLLDQALSRKTSSNTINKDRSPIAQKSILKVPRGPDKKLFTGLSTPPSSPLSRRPLFNIREDIRSKRASAVLQAVSGNEGSPFHDEMKSRPLSIATSDPFQWEQGMSLQTGKPSAMKGKPLGHQRQNCVRISNIPVYIPPPGRLRTTSEEHEEPGKSPPGPVDGTVVIPTNPRPPSRTTFDPQLTPTPAPRSYRFSKMQDSPTFSDLNLHSPVSYPSPPSLLSTPTHKPSTRRPSGAHANRRKPIFDIPSSSDFAFTTPERLVQSTQAVKPATDLILKPVILSNSKPTESPSPNTKSQVPEARSSSMLFSFPSPPHPPAKTAPNWRSPVRGPRALPPTAWRRSPTRVAKVSTCGSVAYPVRAGSPHMDLRKIVGTLRRMDSEASRLERSDSSAKAHKIYTCLDEDGKTAVDIVDKENHIFHAGHGLDDRRSRPFAGRRDRSETCKAFERVLGGPREMPGKGKVIAENSEEARTPGDCYDDKGFLRNR